MRTAIAFLPLMAAAASVAAAQAPAKPAVPAPAGPAANVPLVKDLKFPPLHPIVIPQVETFTLPNGMKVYLLEDHELPLVHGAAEVRTGNLFDPKDKAGLATMTGMVMRTGGTKAKTGDELDVELEDIAASVETSIGETNGSASFSALKENTDEVLGVFHDVLTSPEFRQDKIDLAKTQLRSSIARRNDDAHGISQREFMDTVYGKDTPYGWEMEYASVDAITRDDLQSFYRRYFFPKNVMLAVWGDFKTAEMKAKLEKLFADWTVEQPPVPTFPAVTAKPAPQVFLAEKTDVDQTFFTIGQLGGEFRDKDFAALEIMGDILGGGFQSRLFSRVRTKMGNAYDIYASWGGNFDHPGVFEIAGSTKSVSTVETLKAIMEEVERIRTSEVSDAELQTAKDTALNSLVFAFDTRSKTIQRMLTYEYYGYPRDFIQQYQKALSAVTRADVLRVAKERLAPGNFTTVAVGNPSAFAQPLTALNRQVVPVDLTIPEPKTETAAAAVTPETAAAGKRLLERAQQAAGGKDKLTAIKDFQETADFKLDAGIPQGGGMQITETERWAAPTHWRQDSAGPMGTVAAYSDGTTGWISTPRGLQTLGGAQLKQVQGDIFRVYYRTLLSDTIPGRTVSAVDANTVEIREGDLTARVSFDLQTGLPQKMVYESVAMAGQPQAVEEDFSDYRDVAGVKVPFRVDILQGGKKFGAVTITTYKTNTGLKPEDLSKRP